MSTKNPRAIAWADACESAVNELVFQDDCDHACFDAAHIHQFPCGPNKEAVARMRDKHVHIKGRLFDMREHFEKALTRILQGSTSTRAIASSAPDAQIVKAMSHKQWKRWFAINKKTYRLATRLKEVAVAPILGPREKGGYFIRCPFEDEHSTESPERTWVVDGDGTNPCGLHCSGNACKHGHTGRGGRRDQIEYFERMIEDGWLPSSDFALDDKAGRRPMIRFGDVPMPELMAEVKRVMFYTPGVEPTIFQGTHGLVRLEIDRTTGSPRLAAMTKDGLRTEITNRIVWYTVTDGGDFKYKACPKDVSDHLFSDSEPGAPPIRGLAVAPFFTRGGRLVSANGYDSESQIYLRLPDGFAIPPVSENPTDEEIAHALATILDPFCDFPFAGPQDGLTSKAHLLGMIFQPFVRDMIEGPTPIYLIQKPTRGTGAGLKVEVYGLIVHGEPPQAQPMSSNEEEVRKSLLAALVSSGALLWFDNIATGHTVDSSALAAATTASTYRDRQLGQSKQIAVPVRCTFILSGNNVALSDELARRTVTIILDAKSPDPTKGREFKHPDLTRHVKAHRHKYLHAILTLIQAWIARGRVPAKERLASFESYSAVIGGILQTANFRGFLGDREEIKAVTGDADAPFRMFVAVWFDRFEDNWTSVGILDFNETPDPWGGAADLVHLYLNHHGEIDFGFNRTTKTGWSSRLGQALRGLKGRQFDIDLEGGCVRVEVQCRTSNKGSQYRLCIVEIDTGNHPSLG